MSLLLALALAAAPPAAMAATPPKPVGAADWLSGGDYPVEALRQGGSGVVVFRVEVNEQGRPGACTVIASSGAASLDRATCEGISARARFEPARDAGGRPLASFYENRVSWKMPEVSEDAYRRVIVDLASDGKPVSCRVEAQVLSPEESEFCALHTADRGFLKNLARAYRQVAFETVARDGHAAKTAPKSPLGWQLGRFASTLTYLDDSGSATSCIAVASEGFYEGTDPCAGFRGNRALTAEESARARYTSSENAIFGVPRD